MASDFYYSNSRRTPPKNLRSCLGDRRKIKNDGYAEFKGRQSFVQPQNVDSETNIADLNSSEKALSRSSSYHARNTNGSYRESPSSRRSVDQQNRTFHHKPKQLYAQSVSTFKTTYQKPFPINSRNHSHNSHLEHSKFNSRERHSERSTNFLNQQEEDLFHCSRNQVAHTYDQGGTSDAPIRAPKPVCSDLAICPKNLYHEEEKPPVGRDCPMELETYEMYVNRPDHRVGNGLYFHTESHLPPRFQKQLRREYQKLEQMKKEIKQNSQRNGHNECIAPPQQSEILGNSGVTPFVKNQKYEGYQSTASPCRNIQSQKNSGNESNFSHNSVVYYSHGTKGGDCGRNESKRSSFGHSELKRPAQNNDSNLSNYNDDKTHSFPSCENQTTSRINSTRTFRNHERQLSLGCAYNGGGLQNNQVKRTPANSEQCADYLSGGHKDTLLPQGRGVNEKKSLTEVNVRASYVVNSKHFDCKTSAYDRMKKGEDFERSESKRSSFGHSECKGPVQKNNSNLNNCNEDKIHGVTVPCEKQTSSKADATPAFKNFEQQLSSGAVRNSSLQNNQGKQTSANSEQCADYLSERHRASLPQGKGGKHKYGLNEGNVGISHEENREHFDSKPSTYDEHTRKKDFKRNEGKRSSFGHSGWEGPPAQKNNSHLNDHNEDKMYGVTVSCEKQTTGKTDATPAFKNCEQQLSSGSVHSSDIQNNQGKQTSAKSEQHTDHLSEGCARASLAQGKGGNGKSSHSEGKVRTPNKENREHFDCKTSVYDCTRTKGTPSTSVQSDFGMREKNVHNYSFNSQGRCSSQFNNQANSKKSVIREGSESSFEGGGTKVNESNFQNSSVQKRNERLSFSSDDRLSVGGEQSANNRSAQKNLVKIKVSRDVEKLEYWNTFLQASLPHMKFEVRIDNHVAQMLGITFVDEDNATQARYSLEKVKRKNDGNPYIKLVKSPRCYESLANRSLKILNDCFRDIDKLYNRVILSHDKKIAVTKEELGIVKKGSDRDSVLAVQEKLKELEEMRDVFFRYTEDKKEKMNAEVEKQELDIGVVSRNLLEMKKDFIREYNCLKGGLPIYAKKEVILDVVLRNQVSVLVAETGSGKSTQVVQYLLQSGLNKDGLIICTQPRKIAAVSIAKYISGQIGSPLGATVGYEAGLDNKTGRNTKIVYMTDYVLLKKCVNNRNLEGISCVVVDEAHERSLFTDLLLGIIKKCLPNRPDIRIIITSATIDPGIFQDYFNLSSEAVLAVPGRTYPVQIQWQEADAYVGWNYLEGCVKLARKVHEENDCGDVLVFLTSPQEADEAVNLLKQSLPNHRDKAFPMLFSLHGKQLVEEQINVFNPTPKGCRKIIFATNAAETSITIPGIKFVIDSGMVKEKQYIAEKNRNALVVGFISKSSAEQRKGRAGRTQPGVCYRMYSRQNYAKDMPERVTPEILRINLQLALLKIMEFKIQPEDFDFVETPPKESIASALHSLEFLGAVKNKRFTDLGKKITKLPLEPQLSKLVILGAEENVGYETSIIASIATVSGMVFYRNEDNRIEADKKKVKFCKEEGDFLTFLNVFKQWYYVRRELKPQWCADNCINAKAMKIAFQTMEELVKTMHKELRINVHKRFKPPDVFDSKRERILFECFSENVCVFSGHKRTGYISPFDPGSFFVHPSSSLCYLDSKFHNFLIFSSVLKTSRTFLLNVTPIQESTIISAYEKGVFPYQIDMLKQLQILPARIHPVGDSILIREILGRQGSKLHEIEQQIIAFTKTDAFHVDVKVGKGEILVYIEQKHHSIVSKLMNTVIQEAQCHMAKEEEIFRIAECASSCFAVSSGGIVNDILLPGEFREVIVEGYRKGSSVDKVVSRLKDFGTLQSFQETEEHGNSQILATYVKVTDAQKAVEHLQKLKLFDISSKVSYAKLSDKSLPLFRLQVTWPRFPCLGTGWISFQTVTDCIEASGILTNRSFYIGDHYVLFTPAKTSERELHMKNLPSYVEPKDVTSALNNHLPDYLKVKNVNLVRAKPYRASKKEMNSIKKQLSQMFGRYTPSSKLVVDLKSPNAYEVLWIALVYFENFEDGEQALKDLKDKAKIDEHKLHIRPVLKSSLHCDTQIFKMVEKNLHVLMAYSKKEGICTEFDIKPASAKNSVLITFSCSDIKNLNKVRQEVLKLVRGTTLPCSDRTTYSKLFSKSGEEYIKGIQQSTQSIISTNSFRKTITIFGSERAVSSAKALISCYLSTSSDEEVRVFNLSGKKIPCGFLKALRQKFGFRLFGLIEKFNLRAADVDFVNRKLTVKCSGRTMQMVEQCLAELCVEVEKSSAKNQSSNQESCPVCMDIITSDLYRLNHCGHAFCRQCLLLQMESKIIPLVCAKEGCEKPFFVEDINKLLSGNEELRKDFSQAALKNFISKNSSVRYCPVPDCSMVYRVTSQGSEFHCPSCENDICTRCHAFYHHGMTCEMFQGSRVDGDYSLKVWMKEDSENRKLCPKCSAAIEKNDGCNHILCTVCDTHLCWLCLRTFSCGEDVYEHMPYCDYLS